MGSRLAEQDGIGAVAGMIAVVALVVLLASQLRAEMVPPLRDAFVNAVQLVGSDRQPASEADAERDQLLHPAMGWVSKWLREMTKKPGPYRLPRSEPPRPEPPRQPPRAPQRPSAEELRIQRELAARQISETSERLVRLREAQRASQEALNRLSGLERDAVVMRMNARRREIEMLEARLAELLRNLPPL